MASDVVIVANPSVTASTVSAEELTLVFRGTKTSLGDGSAVAPALALRNHFKSLVFTGKGSMPKTFNSDAEIVAHVAKTKGAIGYLAAAPAAGGVKRLTVK